MTPTVATPVQTVSQAPGKKCAEYCVEGSALTRGKPVKPTCWTY